MPRQPWVYRKGCVFATLFGSVRNVHTPHPSLVQCDMPCCGQSAAVVAGHGRTAGSAGERARSGRWCVVTLSLCASRAERSACECRPRLLRRAWKWLKVNLCKVLALGAPVHGSPWLTSSSCDAAGSPLLTPLQAASHARAPQWPGPSVAAGPARRPARPALRRGWSGPVVHLRPVQQRHRLRHPGRVVRRDQRRGLVPKHRMADGRGRDGTIPGPALHRVC